ncbi:MAG TPA: hypothetical protein VJL29_14845 [Thermoguttaceae bacterium]|nr:hypothetical protein [Thermoguttaceae bacterium]
MKRMLFCMVLVAGLLTVAGCCSSPCGPMGGGWNSGAVACPQPVMTSAPVCCQ